MRQHPRIRKTIKWGGAAVTVLLVVVWVGSWQWFLHWPCHGANWLIVGRGMIEWTDPSFLLIDPRIDPDLVIQRMPEGRDFHGELQWYVPNPFNVSHHYGVAGWFGGSGFLLLWPFAAAAGAITAAAWYLDGRSRRKNIGRCPKCGYDRAGIAKNSKCPECGAATASV